MMTYSELKQEKTLLGRFKLLQMNGTVGRETFGFDRVFYERFCHDKRWKQTRHGIIVRDNGCDLGIEGYEIGDRIIIHHINPLSIEDLEEGSWKLYDPENLICVSHMTHEAIHYGDENLLPREPIERKPYDTCPWRV